ncbi:MAG TPA: efflux RND transporter periplasmic adaptor subunit [Candidatus Binatia bacterium]|nr:efflux RND transporter periplasmic adaptor subunit [Candidatus Binatia bacterium]
MRRRRVRRQWLRALCAGGALCAAFAGCRGGETPVAAPPAVTVARPTVAQVIEDLEFTGTTSASQSVTLVARVEGYLEQIHFTDGALVEKGDLLFTIQQDQYQAQLRQAEAQVAAQKASLQHASTELARYTGLVKEASAPQTEVDRWQYERDSAAAALLGAEAQVELAKLNLGYTTIRAPFDGRMGRHLVDVGNLVGAMGQQTSLAEIDRTDPLYVYFTVNERDLLRIREKVAREAHGSLAAESVPAAFGLLDESGFPHAGRLEFAALSVVPTTGTLQARATFPNPDPPVLPGLFARVRIPAGPPHDALLVPGVALSFDQQGEYVLVVNDANVVERRAVTTGQQQGESFVVREGISRDDWVVVDGLAQAVPGRTVAPDRSSQGAAPRGSPGAAATPAAS